MENIYASLSSHAAFIQHLRKIIESGYDRKKTPM